MLKSYGRPGKWLNINLLSVYLPLSALLAWDGRGGSGGKPIHWRGPCRCIWPC